MTHGLWRIRDPMYGVSTFDEIETLILLSPELQRLRYIRMCNINSLLVIGASETGRFEHSVGVLNLAKHWIISNPNQLNKFEQEVLRYAALIHDIQTGPFGHSMQYLIESDDKFEHSNIESGAERNFYQTSRMATQFEGREFNLRRILGDYWKDISLAVDGKSKIGSLIANSIDLDNIDNVYRMAFHMGILERSEMDMPKKIVENLRFNATGELSVLSKGVEYIENWHEVRSRVYKDLLLDWAEFSAKAMLTRAMELALENRIISTDSWIKTDDELIEYLIHNSSGDYQDIAKIVRSLRIGELYRPLGLLVAVNNSEVHELSNLEKKYKIEETISSVLLANFGERCKVILHFIEDRNKTYRNVPIKIYETGEQISIGKSVDRMLVGIFTSKPMPRKKFADAEAMCLSILRSNGVSIIESIRDPLIETAARNINSEGLF